jgi:hypothetical protein
MTQGLGPVISSIISSMDIDLDADPEAGSLQDPGSVSRLAPYRSIEIVARCADDGHPHQR